MKNDNKLTRRKLLTGIGAAIVTPTVLRDIPVPTVLRERLTSDVTYYVGESRLVGVPTFKTVQEAYKYIVDLDLDFAEYTVTIQVLPSTNRDTQ